MVVKTAARRVLRRMNVVLPPEFGAGAASVVVMPVALPPARLERHAPVEAGVEPRRSRSFVVTLITMSWATLVTVVLMNVATSAGSAIGYAICGVVNLLLVVGITFRGGTRQFSWGPRDT